MAIYTTFFLCTSEELAAGFPDWKPPLSEPVLREVKNPFTGAALTIPSLVPDWPNQGEVSLERAVQSIDLQSSYENYLESRLPKVVRDHPHWAAKGIATFQLTLLSDELGVPSTLECPLYGPPTSSEMLVEFPEPMFSKLKSLDLSDLSAIAGRWTEKLLPPEDFEPVEGEPVEEPWSAEFALSILEPIVGLVKKAKDGERMYLFVEI